MEYTFNQLRSGSIKKELAFIVLLSIIILFTNVILIELSKQQQWSESVSIVIFIVVNICVLGVGIFLFLKKNSITKELTLHSTSISVKEIKKNGTKQHNGNFQNVSEYLITPDMIRCFRYISGSDEANRFEINTHQKSKQLVIPNPFFKADIEKYNLFMSQLHDWLKMNNVSNCADLKK